MDHQAAPLLTLNSINSCLLCEKDINGKFVKFTDKGWKKVVENAGRWKNFIKHMISIMTCFKFYQCHFEILNNPGSGSSHIDYTYRHIKAHLAPYYI